MNDFRQTNLKEFKLKLEEEKKIPKSLRPIIDRIEERNSFLVKTKINLYTKLTNELNDVLNKYKLTTELGLHKLISSRDKEVLKVEYENFIDYLRILAHYIRPKNALYPGSANDYAFAIAFENTEWVYLDVKKKL